MQSWRCGYVEVHKQCGVQLTYGDCITEATNYWTASIVTTVLMVGLGEAGSTFFFLLNCCNVYFSVASSCPSSLHVPTPVKRSDGGVEGEERQSKYI